MHDSSKAYQELIEKNALLKQRIQDLEKSETDCRQAEDTLKKSEAQFCLLLNSTAEAIYSIDLQGNCTFANLACLRILGYIDSGQLLGKNMHQLIHHSYPDGRPMAVDVCRIYRAFRVGKGEHVDDEVLWRADGSSFPAEYWSFPQMADGKVVGAVVAFVDITERKRLENKLRKDEQILRASQRLAKVGGWEWNVNTQTASWTDETYRIHDFDPSEFPLGSSDFIERSLACYSRDDRIIVREAFQRCAEYGEPYDMQFPFTTAKGRRLWIRTAGEAVMDGGRVSNVIGTIMDISDLVRAEEALRQSEKQFRAVADYTPGVENWIGPDGKILWINPMVFDFTGYTIEECMTMADYPMALVDEADRERIRQLFNENIHRTNNATGSTECQFICKNGQKKWVEVSWRPIYDEHGCSLGLRASARDITIRKRAEEEREKLIHELRKALSKIKTLSGLLPICASCKKIRNDKGYWEQLEGYIQHHSDAEFSHSICPDCAQKLYPKLHKKE